MVNLIEKNTPSSDKPRVNDGFTVVKPKKKRSTKPIYTPPTIDYDYSTTYFKNVTMNTLKHTQGTWGNAFTSLALHTIC